MTIRGTLCLIYLIPWQSANTVHVKLTVMLMMPLKQLPTLKSIAEVASKSLALQSGDNNLGMSTRIT
jgi:hypothetical protein